TVYLNLRRTKQYYKFVSPADVDRYVIDNQMNQVMIAAREISPSGLSAEAKTWLNTHLFYTHGYGVVVSSADGVVRQGQPDDLLGTNAGLVQGRPAMGSSGPSVDKPQLYYGENEEVPFVVAHTKQQELDHPTADRVGY